MPTDPPTSRRGAAAGKGRSPAAASRRARRRAGGRRSILWRWRRFFFLCALLFVLGVAGAGWMMTRVTLPPSEAPLAQTTFICAADVDAGCDASNSMAQLTDGQDRVTVTYEQLPQLLVDAVVAAEDREFFEHSGVDPAGIVRAFWSNFRNSDGNTQGASTITQQYVKNAYLTQERTWSRKIKEAALAVQVERELSKQEILARYLNVSYLGRGAYGVQAAAQAYFGKDLAQLDLKETAYLAGLLRSPELSDAQLPPDDPRAAAQRSLAATRRNDVLFAMLDEGFITQAAYDEARASGWDHVKVRTTAGNYGRVAHRELGTEYFLDYVTRWLVESGNFTSGQVHSGGLRVYTTLDYARQAEALEAITSTLDRDDDPAASLVSLDGQGRVVAMVGGLDHDTSQVNLAVGAAGGGSGRQPGSSFKPIVLAEALEQGGHSLNDVYDSPGTMTFPKKDDGKDWKVGNYSDAGQGNLSLLEATKQSSNTAYAQLMLEVGPENTTALAKRMGITGVVEPVPSQVLGTASVSVLDMATAYSTFANEGERVGPFVVDRVTDAQGTVLWEAPTERERVLSPEVVEQVSWALSQVIEGGTGEGAGISQPAAGKTGTTDEYRDAWFVGYTCSLTTAVWMGYPEADEQGRTRYMKNVHGREVTGGSFPATIWRKYMEEATDGLPSCPYERPSNVGAGTSVPGTGVTTSTTPSSTTTSSTPPTTDASPTTTEPPPPTTTEPPPPTTTEPPATTSTTAPP